MGDLLAVDFINKKSLGKVETVQQANEVSMAEIEREIAAALYGVPVMFVIPDAFHFVAPDKDPA